MGFRVNTCLYLIWMNQKTTSWTSAEVIMNVMSGQHGATWGNYSQKAKLQAGECLLCLLSRIISKNGAPFGSWNGTVVVSSLDKGGKRRFWREDVYHFQASKWIEMSPTGPPHNWRSFFLKGWNHQSASSLEIWPGFQLGWWLGAKKCFSYSKTSFQSLNFFLEFHAISKLCVLEHLFGLWNWSPRFPA